MEEDLFSINGLNLMLLVANFSKILVHEAILDTSVEAGESGEINCLP